MSKLADRIRRASRPAPTPLGFTSAAAAPRKSATLLALVRLNANEAGKAAEAVQKGADAVIVQNLDPGKARDAVAKAADAALGAALERADREAVSALREAGVDFVVLDPEGSLADSLLDERVGYVLPAHLTEDDTALRLLGDLGIDALIVPAPDGTLNIRKLLQLRRIFALTRTPLLTEVRPDADASTLQALRESGVVGVIVDSGGIGKLEKLRERILSLPPRGRRREEKEQPLLPLGIAAGHDHDEDDEE
jgi:hypothetical protein